MATTQYVRPPRKRTPAKKSKPEGELTQIRKFMWRHRDDMAPIGAALVVLLVALLMEPYPLGGLWLLLGGLVLGGVAYAKPWASSPRAFTVHTWRWRSRANIPWEEKERVYAGGAALAAGAWAAWFTMGGVRPLAAFPFLVALVAWPWWRHHATQHSVPVTMAKELTGRARRHAEAETRAIIDGWDVITRMGRIPLAKLLGITWDIYSMSVLVELKSGMSRRTLAYQGYSNSLESAFNAPENSLRVEDPGEVQHRKKTARLVRLRFLMVDPNAEPLGPPRDRYGDEIRVGRFETGGDVIFDEDTHTGVFGMTGAGKSGVINTVIRKLRRRRTVALVGFDLKPGAPELSPWAKVFYFLADNPQKAEFAFKALIRGMEERGAMMTERGWRRWKATPAEPDLVIIVDEAQELNDHKLMGYLERLAGLIRAYGGRLIVATQHPKDGNLPTTIYNALKQIIGMKVSAKADRVVFGETANRDGWVPSKLEGDGGRFLIQSPRYRYPTPARGYWMEDKDVKRECEDGPEAVQLDARTGMAFLAAGMVEPMDGTLVGSGGPEAPLDIVDAEVVEDDGPRAQVLEAVRNGIGTPTAISKATKIPDRTVRLYLQELAAVGAIHQDGKRKPWRTLD